MRERYKEDLSAGQSRSRLIRSALGALIAAVIVTVIFIMPAEYGVDPTGIGGKLGLLNLTQAEIGTEAEVEHVITAPRVVTQAFPEIPTDFDYYEPEVLTDPFSRVQIVPPCLFGLYHPDYAL